jgi:hypothetical protein
MSGHAYAAGAARPGARPAHHLPTGTDAHLRDALSTLPDDACETLAMLVGESDVTVATMLSVLPFGSRSALEAAGLAEPASKGSKVWALTLDGQRAVQALIPLQRGAEEESEEHLQAALRDSREAAERAFGPLDRA